RLWSLSRSAFAQAGNPRGSPPGDFPLVPLVSFDAYHAVGLSQRYARPSSWDPTILVYSSFILSLCKMWVRIRSLDRGGMARSFLIAIAIAAMNRRAEAMADSLHPALSRS